MPTLSNNLKITETKNNENSSTFVLENLTKRNGITIGNFLRRILLEQIEGIGLFAVKIINNDIPIKTIFNTLVGVDQLGITAHLISQLKEIVVDEKSFKGKPVCTLELKIENKGKENILITTKNFNSPEDELIIKNPELTLFNLSPAPEKGKNNKLEIKLFYRKSCGIEVIEDKKSEWNKKKLLTGFFPEEEVDSIIILDNVDYSPVDLVNPQIEEGLDGEEKLFLTVNTNSSISPKEAFSKALELAQSSLKFISEQLKQL